MNMHVCKSMSEHDMYRYLCTGAHGCIGYGCTHVRIGCVCMSVCERDHVQVCTCACVCTSVPVNIWGCACVPVYGELASSCLLVLPFLFIWFHLVLTMSVPVIASPFTSHFCLSLALCPSQTLSATPTPTVPLSPFLLYGCTDPGKLKHRTRCHSTLSQLHLKSSRIPHSVTPS